MAWQKPVKRGQMPISHHEHDADWISGKLNMCASVHERASVCEAYSKVYQAAFDGEARDTKKAGTARRRANLRLLAYIKKKSAVFN